MWQLTCPSLHGASLGRLFQVPAAPGIASVESQLPCALPLQPAQPPTSFWNRPLAPRRLGPWPSVWACPLSSRLCSNLEHGPFSCSQRKARLFPPPTGPVPTLASSPSCPAPWGSRVALTLLPHTPLLLVLSMSLAETIALRLPFFLNLLVGSAGYALSNSHWVPSSTVPEGHPLHVLAYSLTCKCLSA